MKMQICIKGMHTTSSRVHVKHCLCLFVVVVVLQNENIQHHVNIKIGTILEY